jgi:hypothetical protein
MTAAKIDRRSVIPDLGKCLRPLLHMAVFLHRAQPHSANAAAASEPLMASGCSVYMQPCPQNVSMLDSKLTPFECSQGTLIRTIC